MSWYDGALPYSVSLLEMLLEKSEKHRALGQACTCSLA